MGKGEKPQPEKDNKANKGHKTLREKLRKRREQQKRHKKEKSEKKKQYNPEEEKLNFFQKGENKQDPGKSLKLKKIQKSIEKFINIYEDDLNEFYDMFKTFDEGGGIDISGLQNKALYKCLKKLFKYLPLTKSNGEYKKSQNASLNLETFIRNKVTQAIEHYLQYGSQKSHEAEQSSAQEVEKTKKSQKKSKINKVQVKEEDQQPVQPLRLYKQVIPQGQTSTMGPCIPAEEREKLAQMFDQQLEEMKKQKQIKPQPEQDEFDQIFGMYQTRKQMKATSKPPINQGVPEHLMAAGSAVIGQKVQINEAEIEEYNRTHRPKKLIQIHKELNYGQEKQDKKKRKPFNRERDVLGEGKTSSFMTNSTFFDFRNKMSKPKSTNQFL